MTDLTTLQLARRIADAVVDEALRGTLHAEEYVCRHDLDHEDPPTQAVLRTLYDTGSWFCRIGENEQGFTAQTMYEPVQQDLFR